MIYLIATVLAHMHMSSPSSQFVPAFVNDRNSPAFLCSLVPYYPGSNQILIPKFNNDLKSIGFGSLREYADACAKASQAKSCGNTIPSAVVPMPSDGAIKIAIAHSANHIGPSELWVDDKLVMYNPGMVRGTIQKTPEISRVDFATVCPSGNCRVRFVMVALHNFPAEVFDNCVTVSGSRAESNSLYAVPSVEAAVISKNSAPVLKSPPLSHYVTTPAVAKPEVTSEGSQWSCSPDNTGLIRTVGADRYEFACPRGTRCTTTGVPYAMCNHSKCGVSH